MEKVRPTEPIPPVENLRKQKSQIIRPKWLVPHGGHTQSKDGHAPSKILEAIGQQAVEISEAAADLSAKIVMFESYLSRIRGRVEAVSICRHPDDYDKDQVSLYLEFCKQNSEWKIMWARIDWNNFNDWIPRDHLKPLKDAPLKIKVYAVSSFPELLESIKDRQGYLIAEVKEATTCLDEFLASLPPAKEGK
jgi:hypothetical protein